MVVKELHPTTNTSTRRSWTPNHDMFFLLFFQNPNALGCVYLHRLCLVDES